MASETCRIDGIVAAEANKAVIFRRGPSQVVQLLKWDLSTDEVVPGQWLRARVDTACCDVSPDGRYLVISARDYRLKGPEPLRGVEGWTAISKPPYFSALALWFAVGGGAGGGGIWKSNSVVELVNVDYWDERIPLSNFIKASQLQGQHGETVFSMKLQRHGWRTTTKYLPPKADSATKDLVRRLESFPDKKAIEVSQLIESNDLGLRVMEKSFTKGKLVRVMTSPRKSWSVLDLDGKVIRAWQPKTWYPQWLDVDANDRVIFGEKGCLWAWADFPKGEPKIIVDLNNNKFEAAAPPKWALEW